MATIEMKFHPCSGTFVVQNSNDNLGRIGAVEAVASFLKAHAKHFGKMPADDGMGMVYWLEAGRVGKFKLYARGKGFKVAMGW